MDPDSPPPCRICGHAEGHRRLVVREMVFGLGESFDYVECAACGSIRIAHVPTDLARFYPPEYGPLAPRPSANGRGLRSLAHRIRFGLTVRPSFRSAGGWYELLRAWEETDLAVEAVARHRPDVRARILDVGCGRGRLLQVLDALGYQNLDGIDPFLPADRTVGRVRLRRVRLEDLPATEEFDLIVLHHSIEHVPDPIATLGNVARHLAPRGWAVVATPIVAEAFRTYGVHWYQLDAPRHLHVFSLRGFQVAASRSGLVEFDRYFNSRSDQFRLSEQYARGLPMTPSRGGPRPLPFVHRLTPRERAWRRRAAELNRAEQGDQAVFYLRRAAPEGTHGNGAARSGTE